MFTQYTIYYLDYRNLATQSIERKREAIHAIGVRAQNVFFRLKIKIFQIVIVLLHLARRDPKILMKKYQSLCKCQLMIVFLEYAQSVAR